MIRQYLSNTNESVTIHILQKVLEVNEARDCRTEHEVPQAAVPFADSGPFPRN